MRIVYETSSLVAASSPSWADKTTAIASAVGAAGFLAAAVGAWLAYGQLKETRRDRHIVVLSEFGKRWDDQPLLEARDKLLQFTSQALAEEVEKWFTPPREEEESVIPIVLRVPNFFEDLAIMVELGRLELKYVAKTFRAGALKEWGYWQAAVLKMRELTTPTAYAEFEKMVSDLGKLADR